MTVLVTGAAGHVGLTLIPKLLEAGRRVRAVDTKRNPTLDALPIEFVQADVRDLKSLEPAFRDVEVVYHMAAYISIQMHEWPLLEAINVGGVRNMITLCKRYGVRRLMHFSSIEALTVEPPDRPIDETNALVAPDFPLPYPRSKAMGQRIVLQAIQEGLNAVIIYPTGIIGLNDYNLRAANQMIYAVAAGQLNAVPNAGYDFVDVRDVVAGAMAAEAQASAGTSYVFGNRRILLPEIAEILSRHTGHRVPMVVPAWTMQLAQPFMTLRARLTGKPSMVTRASLYPLLASHAISHARAARDLGYHPRPVETTLADAVAWFRQIGKLPAQPQLVGSV